VVLTQPWRPRPWRGEPIRAFLVMLGGEPDGDVRLRELMRVQVLPAIR
jgi:hypothetical protein